ncbi:MAG: nucleotide-binding protein [Planctomycetes bacterium]|nr:nucleotide-binding protein [Planctomycetota bacterium]
MLKQILSQHSRLANTQLSLTGEDKSVTGKAPRSTSKKVFIVHGRDEAKREIMARFLKKIKLDPIILHEQANEGRTIIEKFFDYSDVAFAVILLTADDRGGLISDSFEDQKKRARQNVILELGFFLGKLGRKHVCALYEEGVQIPSDYQGVLFIPIDQAEAWKMALARELKSAGLPVDINDIL